MSRRITPAESEKGLPQIGDELAGKYRVERALGFGGMGAVFEVTHLVTRKRFAIKWMLRDGIEDENSVRRFIREAQIASRIDHPHVVQVYDVHQDGAVVFLVMELLEGFSLAELLSRHGKLAPREAVRLILASMEGLVAAHAAGVVHRDIKPANIFVCKARPGQLEQPKVLDFGISRLTNVPATPGDSTTESGSITGTPYYMAPEQMLPGPVDARVDVYALGITLYELIAGQRPYTGSTYAELVVKISLGEAVPLDQVAPEVPSALAALVARAMHRTASQRYESVEACRQELQRLATAMDKPAPPRARPARARTLLVPALVVMLAALLGASATWWSLRRDDPATALRPAPNRTTVRRAEETRSQALQAEPLAPQAEAAPADATVPDGVSPLPQPFAASPRPARRVAPTPKPKASEPATAAPEAPAAPLPNRPQRPTLSLDRDNF